jgi:RNA polymerase sigma factor (TIGR02999 family)
LPRFQRLVRSLCWRPGWPSSVPPRWFAHAAPARKPVVSVAQLRSLSRMQPERPPTNSRKQQLQRPVALSSPQAEWRAAEGLPAMSEITGLLQRVNEGESGARDALFSQLYSELRQLARSRLRRSEPVTVLNTTSLIHESYLRFVQARSLVFEDRTRFFAFAAHVMHSVVVDEVRKRHAERRGGGAEHVDLDTSQIDASGSGEGDERQILQVHEALNDLAALEPRLAQVVEMRYYGGLTETEIAEALGVNERTVRRDWDKARALLFDALKA